MIRKDTQWTTRCYILTTITTTTAAAAAAPVLVLQGRKIHPVAPAEISIHLAATLIFFFCYYNKKR